MVAEQRMNWGPGAVAGADAPQASEHIRRVRPEDAAIDVRLVHDDVPQALEQCAPRPVVGEDAHVEHVRVGEEHLRPAADAAALRLGRIAVVDSGA